MARTSWPPFGVISSKDKLDNLRELLSDPLDDRGHKLPSEVIGWLSRLLVVRSCGHLEQVVQVCSQTYVESKSGGPARSFGLSWLEKSRNPRQSALEEHLGRFAPDWRDAFNVFMEADDQRLHRDLASAVDKRNRIAHGENEGATRDQALRLCDALQEISQWWTERLNPNKTD